MGTVPAVCGSIAMRAVLIDLVLHTSTSICAGCVQASYLVPILHALKYPANSVNGVLLGKFDNSGIQVIQALPLLHAHLALAPMMDAGCPLP